MGLVPGSGRSPGEGNGNPLQYSCLEKFPGQRSLTGYSPWGCKESDMTERQEATVRTGHGTTDWFQIGKGVHQGSILLPCLFNLYADKKRWAV